MTRFTNNTLLLKLEGFLKSSARDHVKCLLLDSVSLQSVERVLVCRPSAVLTLPSGSVNGGHVSEHFGLPAQRRVKDSESTRLSVTFKDSSPLSNSRWGLYKGNQ